AGLSASLERGRHVHVGWTANAEPDLAGYHVYRALTASAPFVRLTSTPVTTNEFLDADRSEERRVGEEGRARGPAGHQTEHDVALSSAMPPALLVRDGLADVCSSELAGVSASLESGRKVHVRWTANAEPDLAGYYVYRTLTASAPFVRLTSTPVTTNEFLDAD